MSKQRFPITDFSKGIIRRADAEDIAKNACYDSNNIDASSPLGTLMAIPTSASKTLGTTTLATGKLFDWIKTKDNKHNLIYADSGYLNVVTDFYNSSPGSYFGATSIASTATSMVVHNEEVRVANGTTSGVPTAPTWIGYCDYGQFGGSTKGWQHSSTKIDIVDVCSFDSAFVVTVTPNSGIMAFDSGSTYYYTLTAVYDGIQETPIMQRNTGGGITNYFIASSDYSDATIYISLKTSEIPSRVTAIKLYRKELNTNNNTSLWRLQQSFNIISSTAYTDRNGTAQTWGTSGSYKTITYVDNNTDILSSYEQQSGIPETLESSDVYYSLNCDLNAYHYVAGCYKSSLPDSPFMLFRSKQYRYDTFNWISDYLKLPTMPLAMKAFGGKIWVFSENNIYIINPDGLYIEKTTTGIGCLSQRSIVVTDYGMFWCDYKNAYWHNGEQIIPIGEPIRTDVTSTYDWSGFSKNYTVGLQDKAPIVIFHSPKNIVLFIIPDHTNLISNVWAYHIPLKRFDCWRSFTICGNTSTGFGAFTGRNGECFIANGTSLEEPLAGTGYRSYYWISPILDFDSPSLTKVFYKPIMESTSLTSTPTITYGKNRATPTSSLTTGEFISGGEYETGKLMQIKITEGTGYGNIVYSVDIVARKYYEL